MCNPALIGLAIAVVGEGYSIVESNQNANKTEKLLKQQLNQRQDELSAQSSQEAGTRIEQARAEAAKRLVAAGEAGVSGNSAEAELNNTMGQANQDIGTIASNAIYGGVDSTLRAQSEALGIHRTSGVAAGLQIANAGMSGYSSGLNISRPRKS